MLSSRTWWATGIRRWVSVVLLAVLFPGSLFATPQADTALSDESWRFESSLFRSQAYPYATGSGIVVDELGHVLTAFHVVKPCRELLLHQGEATIPARVVAADSGLDLALLQADRRLPGQVAHFREAVVARGEPLVVAGFPREVSGTGLLKAQSGWVASLTDPRAGPSRMRISAVVNSGTSGGPVLDRSGRVIGLVVGMLYDKGRGAPIANPGVAIKGEALRSFLGGTGVALTLGRSAPSAIGTIANEAARFTLFVACRK